MRRIGYIEPKLFMNFCVADFKFLIIGFNTSCNAKHNIDLNISKINIAYTLFLLGVIAIIIIIINITAFCECLNIYSVLITLCFLHLL